MRAAVSLLLLLLFLTPAIAISKDAVVSPVQPLWSTTIDEETGESYDIIPCTTFSINKNKGLWVTAAHCVRNAMSIGEDPATPVHVNPSLDIAVVSTSVKADALKLRSYRPTLGMPIRVVGFPLNLFSIQVMRGYISSLDTKIQSRGSKMIFDLTTYAGFSGSPILDEEGKVVSIMQFGFGPSNHPGAGMSGGIAWEDLSQELKPFVK